MAKSKVAVLKTKPETVLRDIEKLMHLADFEQFLDKNKPVILKDNISWHLPFLSANTTPWQLEGVILALKNAGYKDISAVHNSTVVTNPYLGEVLNKLAPIYKKYHVQERNIFIPQEIKWIDYRPKAAMKAMYKIYPDGIKIPEFFIDKNIVHLPTVKTHIYTTTTGSMKNAFGGLINTKRHYSHSVIHETLVDLLNIQQEIHGGIFTVSDGTICGNGPGPRTMIPVEKDYILASGDSVAIDAVASRMMGFNPQKIEYIRLADQDGLGSGKTEEIEITGEDISGVNFNFSVGDNLASKVGDLCWFGPLKKIQKLFFHTPLVGLFILGSFCYHDYIWWPFKGRKIQKNLRQTSQWGKLFENYPA
ncbi:MAG: DUF362 domain-containing protein [Candidatus Omnitrophota bacterium]|nr:DUF362 domain-containing protein [Candidatus Omnitrophota bacterium]